MNFDEGLNLLRMADVLLDDEDFDDGILRLNMSDVWAWAYADLEEVPQESIIELAKLFFSYGWAGINYWVSERNNQRKSEFSDVNRRIQFVREEERIKKQCPNDSERAYKKATYTISNE